MEKGSKVLTEETSFFPFSATIVCHMLVLTWNKAKNGTETSESEPSSDQSMFFTTI